MTSCNGLCKLLILILEKLEKPLWIKGSETDHMRLP